MSQPIEPGVRATDFTLKDQDENQVSLSSFAGKKVLLSFHPLAWTPICRDQMQALDENHDRFAAKNCVPLGLSVDALPSKSAWAEALGLKKLRILADFWPHGGVAESLGIFRDKNGFSERANILVDERGNVAWVKVYPIKTLPDIEEVLRAL
jgi:peroxiredoxin